MELKKKSGFTLLEIIIVIIIVGVLASLALPRFFSTVEFAKSTEALASLGAVRQSLERFYLAHGSTYTGSAVDALDLEDPSNSPNHHFTYDISNQSANGYRIQATRNTLDGGTSGDLIYLILAGNSITRGGTGRFVGIQ